jgi:hypothetical protein
LVRSSSNQFTTTFTCGRSRVVRQVNRGHASGAQLALDDVSVGRGGAEAM